MIRYDLLKICKARGIDRPYSFFKAHGFSDTFASNVKNDKVTSMRLSTLEKVCVLLYCTPHDLMEWIPDKASTVSSDHPIRVLQSDRGLPDMTSVFESIPLEKLNQIKEFIDREKEP